MRNFEAHPALKQCCDKRYPPLLFHKKGVSDGTRGAVGDDLKAAILEPKTRVVGVVVNAIDDFLSKGDQMPMVWSINRISPLGALLKLARDSGRVVVLASDHGHVWHRPEAAGSSSEEGSRWRVPKGEVRHDEILITGGRVRDENGGRGVVAQWAEAVHHGRPQNGYHGGVTPQEMVCLLVLLTDKSSAYSGLYTCAYPKPEWWSPAPTAAAVVVEPPVRVTLPKGPANLFDNMGDEAEPSVPARPAPAKTGVSAGWVGVLLASGGYKAQKELVRRHAPDDDVVRRCLEALDGSGGIMTPTAFAKAADVAAARLDGLIARIQRLLNVDGYEILTLSRNENRIELNVAKLKRQFDLE